MNLYDFHDKPHQLDYHDRAIKVVPKVLWNRLKNGPIITLARHEDVWAKDAKIAYEYSKKMGRPFRAGEPAIATDGAASYKYAAYTLNGQRFKLGEPAIAKSRDYAYLYVQDILRQEWPEAEHTIFTYDKEGAMMYLSMILDGVRIPRIEKYVAQDPYMANAYAQFGIGGRFEAGEKVMKDSAVWDDYQEFFREP